MHFTDLNFKLTFCAGFISSSNSLFNFVVVVFVFVAVDVRHTASSLLKDINVHYSPNFLVVVHILILVLFNLFLYIFFVLVFLVIGAWSL